MVDRCLLYVLLYLLCALVGSKCVSLFLFTALDYEEEDTIEEAYLNSFYFQDQDQHLYQGNPSKILAVTNTYHYLSCMFFFTFEVLQTMVK